MFIVPHRHTTFTLSRSLCQALAKAGQGHSYVQSIRRELALLQEPSQRHASNARGEAGSFACLREVYVLITSLRGS